MATLEKMTPGKTGGEDGPAATSEPNHGFAEWVRTAVMSPKRLMTLLAASLAVVAAAPAAQQHFMDGNDTAWHKYVRAPAEHRLTSPKVLDQFTSGDIKISGDDITFTRLHPSDPIPEVVLDFGLNVAGQVSIKFEGASSANRSQGLPGLRLAFSETLQFLTNRSDFTRSDNAGVSHDITLAHIRARQDPNRCCSR